MLIDTHCHMEWESYAEDIDAVLKRAGEAGVGKIITIGTDAESNTKTRVLVTKYDQIFRCVGYHPECVLVDGFDLAEITRLMKLLESEVIYPKTVGIGECGLDYYVIERTEGITSARKEELRDLQKELFERQILVAIQHELPLSLHVRDDRDDAYSDVVEILSEYFGPDSDYSMRQFSFDLKNLKNEYEQAAGSNSLDSQKPTEFQIAQDERVINGVLHCVSGSAEYVDACREMGFMVSFAGNVTYKNATEIQEHAKRVSIDEMLVETDGPFLSPVPHRGERNEPSYVADIARYISQLKQVTYDDFYDQTTENALKLFKL